MKKIILAVLFLLSTFAYSQTREQLLAIIEENNKVIAELIAENEALATRLDITTTQLEASNAQLFSSNAQLIATNNQLVISNQTINEAVARIEADTQEIARLRQSIEAMVPYVKDNYYTFFGYALYANNSIGGGAAMTIRLGKLPVQLIAGLGYTPLSNLDVFIGVGFMP